MKIWNQLAVALLVTVPMLGQTPAEEVPPAVPILLEAALPTCPPIWRAAHLSGKVTVRVTVKGGHVIETAVLSGGPHLLWDRWGQVFLEVGSGRARSTSFPEKGRVV